MRTISHLLVATFLSAATALAAAADQPTLSLGDAAPKLQAGQWIQGEPVTGFARDKAYLVEFWATWCGPCRVSIPHLNELHLKFKDQGLVVIGQDVWERDESKVPEFVKSMGSNMTYRVALDAKSGAGDQGRMAETWMEAAGQNGIPNAFLVDKQGRIAWIGHPMGLQPATIEQVLQGTYDLQKAAAERDAEQKARGQLAELGEQFSEHLKRKNWTDAEKVLDSMAALLPESQRPGLSVARLEILKGKGDQAGLARLALEVSNAQSANAMLQNQIAWDLACLEDANAKVLAAANTLATRACEASKYADASILDTLARVQFRQGKKDDAIQTQKKAVALAPDDAREQLENTLASYKQGKLPKAE